MQVYAPAKLTLLKVYTYVYIILLPTHTMYIHHHYILYYIAQYKRY